MRVMITIRNGMIYRINTDIYDLEVSICDYDTAGLPQSVIHEMPHGRREAYVGMSETKGWNEKVNKVHELAKEVDSHGKND